MRNQRVGTEKTLLEIFKILAEIGGKNLVGNSKELSDGVIWEK